MSNFTTPFSRSAIRSLTPCDLECLSSSSGDSSSSVCIVIIFPLRFFQLRSRAPYNQSLARSERVLYPGALGEALGCTTFTRDSFYDCQFYEIQINVVVLFQMTLLAFFFFFFFFLLDYGLFRQPRSAG